MTSGAVQPFDSTSHEQELVQRCIAGDPVAWKSFLARYGSIITAVARHSFRLRGLACSESDVDDVLQDTVTALVENEARLLRSFRFEASLRTWLALVARTYARRRIDTWKPAPERPPAPPAAGDNPFDSTRLRKGLSELSPRERRVVTQFFVEGKKYRQIAEAERLPINSIASILYRVKLKLKRLLGQA